MHSASQSANPNHLISDTQPGVAYVAHPGERDRGADGTERRQHRGEGSRTSTFRSAHNSTA